jgi:hypothetical protein
MVSWRNFVIEPIRRWLFRLNFRSLLPNYLIGMMAKGKMRKAMIASFQFR